MNRKLVLILGLIIVCLVGAIAAPFVKFYCQLPDSDALSSGAELRSLFEKFEIDGGSAKVSAAITDRMNCVACLPYTPGSRDCSEQMAGYVAKGLLKPSAGGMLRWHLRASYLIHALVWKYDFPEISKLFFAAVASARNANDIDAICQKYFEKSCQDLDDRDVVALDRGMRSGKFDLEDIHLTSSRLKSCL
jgi:hypothetical protein